MRALDPAQRLGGEGLGEGDVVAAAGVEVRVLATPGHTADSRLPALGVGDRALLTGDTVLGRGTTVVAHPDGRLADYLDSLRRLRDLATTPCRAARARAGAARPGRGRSSIPGPPARSGSSRCAPRSQLGPDAAAQDVVRVVYADVDPVLWPAAELSVRAQLEYLRR